MPCLCKQWRSRSFGFCRSQLIWICTVCHSVCEFVSATWIKQSDWLTFRSRCGILIYSAWQGLRLMDTLAVWRLSQNVFFSPFWKGFTLKGKSFPQGEQIISYQRRPFSEGTLCTGKQRGSHKKYLPYTKWLPVHQMYQVTLNLTPLVANFCCLLKTFANRLDPDQARQNVRPDLDPNYLILWWYSFFFFFFKVFYKKKTHRWQKSMQNYPACKKTLIFL